MKNSGSEIIVAIISGVLGILASFIFFKVKNKYIESETNKKVINEYLDPLIIITDDLRDKLKDLIKRVKEKDSLLKDTLKQLSDNFDGSSSSIFYELWKDENEFIKWTNQMGHYPMSLLYVTALYFSRAYYIRTKLPFLKLTRSTDRELLKKINAVRISLGGEFGIWDEIQDSAGIFIKKDKDNEFMNYWKFCSEIYAKKRYYYFYKVINFYETFDQKTEVEKKKMIESLELLSSYLDEIRKDKKLSLV